MLLLYSDGGGVGFLLMDGRVLVLVVGLQKGCHLILWMKNDVSVGFGQRDRFHRGRFEALIRWLG